MADGKVNELRNEDLRQRIGPAVKELRDREGWSLRDLGARCGVSSAYLSRIERGSSVPSFSILASIASAFRVSPDYFIEFERSARELETALATVLENLAIPRSTWHEFADLSMEAQGSLVDAFNRLQTPAIEAETRHQEAEIAILTHGVEKAIDKLIEIARHDGLTPVDFARHRTQVEEVEGDRFVILDRLCTLPASWLFDQLDVFRGTFSTEPEDPMLLKWWVRAQRSALLKTLDGSVSRALYPREPIRDYIRTGQWSKHVKFPAEQVRQHIDATVRLLRTCPSYQVGVYDGTIPIRMIGKMGAGVLLMTPDDTADRTDDSRGMSLRFTGSKATDELRAYFDKLWDSIPKDHRTNEQIADWLESELESGFAGTTAEG